MRYEVGQLVWYRDGGITDTGIIVFIDEKAADGYSITVLFGQDMSEDEYQPCQLGTFVAPDHA
ncbi:hypothetical protein J7E88_07835 [Streptomyces sp. ISL-10]|uniref:hypothetical protein n=1 Tax=Streptomyces sp. ISL-10 TaxID=2819172 RepID=UPI001BE6CFBF|nr:hypothetical protein [Streptomyces sp. ISL-10]MBT2365232.1 hypothetical protein [Streptomyces sp. ISL-10]